MSTEGQLYRDNVPHGNNILAYDNWSSTRNTITVTANTGKVVYISSVDFIIDDGATITAENITIADSGTKLTDIVLDSINDFNQLFALADKSTLRLVRLDGTNDAMVGELKFMPPIQVAASGTFTITPHASLTLTPGDLGVHFLIRGWEDDVANA